MSYPVYPKHIATRWLDVGRVPTGWEARRLKFAVSLRNEKIEAEGSHLDYMGLEHIESWTGKRVEDESASSEGIATRFVKDDVLFGKLRPYLAKVYLAESEGMATTEALVLVSEPALVPSFLKHLLLSDKFINAVSGSTYGAKMPRANWEFIGGLPILLPSLAEQQQIATFLDWKTGQIDALMGKKKGLLEKLREKRLAVITQAVTRGLNPAAPLRDSGISWLGQVPQHWEVGGFTKYVEHRADYRGKTPEKVSDGIFLVTARNIKSGGIDYGASQEYVREDEYADIMSRGLPKFGDLLFTTEAPLGEVANVDREDIALAQRVIKFRGEPLKLNNYFAKYWMLSAPFQGHLSSLATGSTAKGIKASKLFALRCVVPPLDEQACIVAFLNGRLHEFAAMEEKVESAIDRLTEYRTALITAATTGKIDVRGVRIPQAAA